ncbi:MAG TPA: TetR/AcrR family transcriptional regulator, partial [Longimicrobiales bacterium]|nr:TetR/AcrR family transcriptional regulator [Longimicrobiales bacterium]
KHSCDCYVYMITPRTALQTRSRQTCEALLEAAEALGNTKTFDQLTVQEVAANAGFTIGALYARFPSKASLLEALMARYEAMIEQARLQLGADDAGTSVVQSLADAFADAYEANGGRLRLIESALHAEPELAARIESLRTVIIDLTIDALAKRYPIPRRDLETATLLLVAPLRELFFKREFWPHRTSTVKSQTTRLVEAVTAFLESRVAAGKSKIGRKS